MKSLALLLACCGLVSCIPPPHPDVVAVRQEEELLPPHLRSPALHNPNLQEVLPLSSLLHNGEKLVFEREAHNVKRKEIYNILTHAGFISRRAHSPAAQNLQHYIPQHVPNDFYNVPHLQTQDFLQHL